MKRVLHATSAANSSKWLSATGSRSMQMSVPPEPMRSATRRAWPPAPKVQSTASSPGCGSRMSISSPASTGTCVRVMSRRMAKALRDLVHLRVEFGHLGLVAGTVPDLEVVDGTDYHDVLADARVCDQRRVESHAAGRIEFDVEGATGEPEGQLAAFGAEWVHVGHEAVLELVEALRGV